MKKNKLLMLLPILALTISGCEPSNNSSSNTTTSGSTTTTESAPTVSVSSVISKLQSDPLIFKGDYSSVIRLQADNSTLYSAMSTIESYISQERYYYSEIDSQSGEILMTLDYFANQETGNVEVRYINPLTNEIISQELISNQTGEPVVFQTMYYNPFLLLEPNMGSLVNNVVSFELDSLAGSEIFEILTGYTGVANKLEVTVDLTNGDIENIVLAIENMGTSVDIGLGIPVPVYLDSEFNFTLVSENDLQYLPDVQPRNYTSDHDVLKEALDQLKEGNFTYDYYEIDSNSPTTKINNIHMIADQNGIVVNNLSGVILLDEGVAEFEIGENNELLGSSLPDSESTLSDYIPPFSILPEMFDLVGENTYRFAINGMESALILMEPEVLMGLSNTPDLGTYEITLNSDSISITYLYSYSYTDNLTGETYTGRRLIEATFSNIGTSVFPYDADNLIPYVEQTSWSDVTGLEALLEEYGMDLNTLPWWLPDHGEWNIQQDTFDVIYSYSNSDADTLFNQADKAFKDAGWTYLGINAYSEYSYTITRNNIKYNVSFVCEDGLIIIYLYSSYQITALDNYFSEHFSDLSTINYTIEAKFLATSRPAYIDENGQPHVEEGSEPTTLQEVSSLVKVDGDVLNLNNQYLVNNADGNLYVYSQNSLTGNYEVDQILENKTWDSVFYNLHDLVGGQAFSQIEGEENSFLINYLGSAILAGCAGFSFDNLNPLDFSGVATLDTSNNTLTIVIDLGSGYGYLDSAQADLLYVEQTVTLTISNILTTEIDTSFLG